MIRIAMIAPEFYPPIGGAGIYAVNLVRELAKRDDIDVHVFTPERGENYSHIQVSRYFGDKVYIHNISKADDDFMYNLSFQYNVLRKFSGYHNRYGYNIVHITNLVNMPDLYNRIRGWKIPTVTTVHSTIQSQMEGTVRSSKNPKRWSRSERMSFLLYPYVKTMQWLYMRKSDHLITVSNNFSDMLKDKHRYKGNVEVIHNGVDLSKFDCSISDESCLEKFPRLKGKGPIVLFAGRFIALKGLDVAVLAMKELLNTDSHFVFAGKGTCWDIDHEMEKHGVPDSRYSWFGFIDNDRLPWLYKAASVFILPSYSENFPISLLESMAMGTPCISSNVGAVNEIIDCGETGVLIDPGDHRELAFQIRLMLNNPDFRKRISENGIRMVKENFSSEVMADRHVECYKRVIGEK